ncbi:C2 family cysteine protease [Gemmata sp.]|uniref:C2 family cysteine protease n=1 Tax=Gemmata sp. TaxID=1914242 RepID=UPI003F7084B3
MPTARPAPKPPRTRLTAEPLDARVLMSGTGLTREVWTGLAGTSLAPLAAAIASGVAPTTVGTIGADGLFEAPRNVGDNYGQRVRGYFEAPVTGEYRFYLAADDHAELRLSTDASPANARVIASVTGYTGSRQWTKFASQASAPVALVAGERYYIEALQKEGRGADNLAVRVDVPGAPPSTLPAPAGLFDAFTIAPPPPNAAPTVAAAPAPVTVAGTSTALSALGADDGGEAALRYTWSVAARPSGAADPTFAANGTNGAKATTVTFSKAGSYTLRLTVTDAQGLSATRDVAATVAQTVTQVAVTPGSATVPAGGTRQFAATARDQFGAPLAAAPAFQWVATGAGTISGTGLFTAGPGGGSATVAARVGSVTSPAAAVTVTPPATTDWYAQNLLDDEVEGLTRGLAADGQLSRLDWLGILSSVQDNNVVDANEVADLQRLVVAVPLFSIPDPTRWLANRIATDAVANMLGSTFQTELVGRWFLGTVAPTPVFNGRTFTYAVASGNLYGAGGPRIGDIDQGGLGDCAFLAALGATFGRQRDDSGNATSAVIQQMITDNGDGTYSFRFYNHQTLQAEYVTVDRRIYTGGAKRNGGIFWVALTERAYAQYLEGRSGTPGYNQFGNGDSLGRPLYYVTGRQPAYIDPNSSTFFSQLQSALSSGRYVSTARLGSNTQYVVGGHAYTVTDAYVDAGGVQRIVVRNPWGVDGRTASGVSNDGFIDLTLEQFRASMNYGVNVA